ncbi:MAG: hypothetical protein LKJ88_04890 [Bacilli bacterium]|jgi:hypothetical protein|nr:hypothetical protein [Bacilli bacterium]
MKKTALAWPLVCLLVGLSSCSFVQKGLTFKLICPSDGKGLSLASYADDATHVLFLKNEEVYKAFFSSDYGGIIFDLEKGLKLIQDEHVPYKLARVNTYGNCFLLAKKGLKEDGVSTSAHIISFNAANDKYEANYLNEGIQNNLLHYFYSYNPSTPLIDTFYSDMQEVFEALKTGKDGEEEIDYALLGEPFVSRLLKETDAYEVLYSFTDRFKEMSNTDQLVDGGYAHYPESGLFVPASLDQADKRTKAAYDNFFESYDNMVTSLERNNGGRVITYLYQGEDQKTFSPLSSFGASGDEFYTILNSSKSPYGVNAMGFCSYPVDLKGFEENCQKNFKHYWTSEVLNTSYSSYYNGIVA